MLLVGLSCSQGGHYCSMKLFVAHEERLVVLAIGEVGEQHQGVGTQLSKLKILRLRDCHQLIEQMLVGLG